MGTRKRIGQEPNSQLARDVLREESLLGARRNRHTDSPARERLGEQPSVLFASVAPGQGNNSDAAIDLRRRERRRCLARSRAREVCAR